MESKTTMNKKRNGFTLVELVVALLMVTFIAGALFMFTQSMSRTHVSTSKTEASFTDAMNFADMLQASLAGCNQDGVDNTVENTLSWTDRRWVVGGETVRRIDSKSKLEFDTNKRQLLLTEKQTITEVDISTGNEKDSTTTTIYTRYPDTDSQNNPFRLDQSGTWKEWKDDKESAAPYGPADVAPVIRKETGAITVNGTSFDKYIICVPYVVDADNGGGVEVRSLITAAVPTTKNDYTGSSESGS